MNEEVTVAHPIDFQQFSWYNSTYRQILRKCYETALPLESSDLNGKNALEQFLHNPFNVLRKAMNVRARLAENSVTITGAGIALVSPEMMVAIVGLLITIGGFVWSVWRDKQSQADRRKQDAASLRELKRHNQEVERIALMEAEARIRGLSDE